MCRSAHKDYVWAALCVAGPLSQNDLVDLVFKLEYLRRDQETMQSIQELLAPIREAVKEERLPLTKGDGKILESDFYLWLHNSGLPHKLAEDARIQMQAEVNRFKNVLTTKWLPHPAWAIHEAGRLLSGFHPIDDVFLEPYRSQPGWLPLPEVKPTRVQTLLSAYAESGDLTLTPNGYVKQIDAFLWANTHSPTGIPPIFKELIPGLNERLKQHQGTPSTTAKARSDPNEKKAQMLARKEWERDPTLKIAEVIRRIKPHCIAASNSTYRRWLKGLCPIPPAKRPGPKRSRV